MFDIFPDIHGQIDKLTAHLQTLGYRDRSGAWRHPDPARQAIFLGDFIDRGPANGAVIDIVRRMIEAGSAQAIMGNHELNAIQFHTLHPVKETPLRPHKARNIHQHSAFLAEFPVGSPGAREMISWMMELPIWLEMEAFRAVHACWDDAAMAVLRNTLAEARLTPELLARSADPFDPLHLALETTTKGPETALPEGYAFTDKDGTRRDKVRLKWWQAEALNWADLAMSVPDPSELPSGPAGTDLAARLYPAQAKPVFFGHYWLSGPLQLQAPNALCLDYSAGADGPLVSYHWQDGDRQIDLRRIRGAD